MKRKTSEGVKRLWENKECREKVSNSHSHKLDKEMEIIGIIYRIEKKEIKNSRNTFSLKEKISFGYGNTK